MKLSELEVVVFKSASNLMKKEGETLFKKGLVSYFNGKKLESLYHIYGRVKDEGRLRELNTHIKINLQKKKLEGIECSCEEFKEFKASGYSFMCSHLTATAYKFFSLLSKDEGEAGETEKQKPAEEKKTENIGIGRLTRKVEKTSVHYEAQASAASEKLILNPEELREFLEGIKLEKIKFKYEYIEFTVPIIHKDLPVTFNIKERGDSLVLTTHKQLPVPLNSNNDVYFYKNELYLPSEKQIEKYVPLYEKLKLQGEILYRKDINNCSRLVALLSAITKNINMSEEIKSFISSSAKPEFHLFEEKGRIYCQVFVNYGGVKTNILSESKGSAALIRNPRKEEKIIMEAERYGFIGSKDSFIFTGEDEELFNLLSRKRDSLYSLGTVILGKGFKSRTLYNGASIEASLQYKEDYYRFDFSFGDIEGSELKSAFEAFKAKNRFYKTRNKGFIDFEDEKVQSFFNLFEVLNISENIDEGFAKVEKSKALYLYENIKNKELEFIKGEGALKEIESRLSEINSRDTIVPADLKGTLREYQINGFKWLKNLSILGFGGILADEMGLGKTIQTITFLLSEKNKRSFIVCPTSLIYNWKDEFEKFAPTLKLAIMHGADRFSLLESLSEYDVVLTTYGTLRLDIDYYNDMVFDYLIIDEGQNIKNALAQNTRVIKEVKAVVRFALTGTPVENSLAELWSIFDFIMPGYLYSKESFEEKFVYSEDNLESLKQLIKPFILRRTKKEVMKELPDKIEKKFLVEMTKAQKAVYSSYLKSVRELMKSKADAKIEVFSYLTKLRQICLDPSLIVPEYEGGSGKLKVAMELIKDHIASNGKVLLFSQFTSVLDRIGEALREDGIEYFHLYGSTKPKERINLVNQFNSSEAVKVFLISLKAGGTGLNLTSANLVIHFDPWWNPAVEDQATDRAHRIGQKEAVEVIKLVAKGTIEEKIILLQEDKKELIGSIITGELQKSDLINKLSRKELLQLFIRD